MVLLHSGDICRLPSGPDSEGGGDVSFLQVSKETSAQDRNKNIDS